MDHNENTPTPDSTTPPSGASEPTTPPSGGAGGNDGSSAGSQAAADAFAADKAALEQRARDEQARADRLQAELDKLNKPTPPPPPPTDRVFTRDEFRVEMRRQREMAEAVAALKSEYPEADNGLFDVDQFDTVEQLTAAVKNSDAANKARLEALKAKADEEVRARYAERYGPLDPAPAGGDAGDSSAPPTVEQLRAMSMDEMDAVEAKFGAGAIQNILRTSGR